MEPEHGADIQKGEPPFEVVLEKTSVLGADSLNITLKSKSSQTFKGFLVRVRKSTGDDQAYGTFTAIPKLSKEVDCFGVKQSGITHANNKPKTSISLPWTAPNDADGEYEVLATFVEDGGTYWVKQAHQNKIRVTRNVAAEARTPPPAKVLGDRLLEKMKEAYEGCGVSKGCFGVPAGCVDTFLAAGDSATDGDVCSMMVTWQKKGDKNTFQLNGRQTEGYVAVGISPAKKMYPASVVGCLPESSGPRVIRTYNKDQNGNHPTTDERLGLEDIQPGSIVDGYVFCSFAQKNHRIEEIGQDFNFDSNDYHYLLARSSALGSGGTTLGHHSDRIVSPSPIHITNVAVVSASNNEILIKLHGSFLVVAWLVCASTGMFTARYLKQTHTEVMPFNKAFWFVVHVVCMFTTFFFTVCGIIFIFIKKDGYLSEGLTGSAKWHPILGLILTSLAILQVIIAFFRPHPNTPKRPLFNWVHWFVGNSAHIVGIACIFLADRLSLSGIKEHPTYKWVLTGFVCFHILIHLVMSLQTLWADKQMDSKVKMRAARPGPMKPSGISEEAPGTALRTFLLILYIMGVVGCSVALIYFIAKGPEEDVTS
jgi:hypothetical protein